MKRSTHPYLCFLFLVTSVTALAQIQSKTELEYPYKAADKVKIYSYETQYEVVVEEYENSIRKPEPVLEILRHRIKKNTIKDEITLTEKQKDKLFAMLTAPTPVHAEVAFCYDPHHLIVFYDASDKPFAYIELCLECGIKETSKPFYVNFSLENAEEIRLAFRRFGISYLRTDE